MNAKKTRISRGKSRAMETHFNPIGFFFLSVDFSYEHSDWFAASFFSSNFLLFASFSRISFSRGFYSCGKKLVFILAPLVNRKIKNTQIQKTGIVEPCVNSTCIVCTLSNMPLDWYIFSGIFVLVLKRHLLASSTYNS